MPFGVSSIKIPLSDSSFLMASARARGGPTVYTDPDAGDNMYDYVCWFSGLEPGVAAEATTWSTVKALYE